MLISDIERRSRRRLGLGCLFLLCNLLSFFRLRDVRKRLRVLRRKFVQSLTVEVDAAFVAVGATTYGDAEKVDSEYQTLVSTIDKGVKRGALHRNNGARKKSRAARLRRGA